MIWLLKKNHSMVTSMLSIQNKLSMALDSNRYAVMTIPDLNAAFDVVKIVLLIKHLKNYDLINVD